jgi:hypothetical protein
VDVALGNVRELVVHDVRDPVDVDPPRRDVRGHEHGAATAAEPLERALARLLGLVPVDGDRRDPALTSPRPRSAPRFVRVKTSAIHPGFEGSPRGLDSPTADVVDACSTSSTVEARASRRPRPAG